MSHRVMETLKSLVTNTEVYSIDEAFFNLRGVAEPLDEYGHRYGKMFDSMGLKTALEFVQLFQEWVHVCMGIIGLRMWKELQGIKCIAFEQMPPQKQQITISRSFPKEIYEQEQLERLISEFAPMCAEKLREQHSVCREIRSYIYTNRHRDDQPQRYETELIALPEPTSSMLEIVKCAWAALRRIYQRGYSYKKAGVIFSEIPPPRRHKPRCSLRQMRKNTPA